MNEKLNPKMKGKKMKKLIKLLIVVAALLSLVSPVLADVKMVGMLSEGMGSYIVWESAEKVSRYHVENGYLVFVEELSVTDYPLNSPVIPKKRP
jgi:hypothetical protein